MSQQKILGFSDIVIMSATAIIGIRWIPIAAAMGPCSLLFWLIGAFIFFLPLALIVADFSSQYPKEGGMYVWVKQELGGGPSFIVSWCYWVTNFFYYPAILTFFAASIAYAFNRADLANNEKFITIIVIVAIWALTILTLFGLKISRWVVEFGGVFGSFLIIGLLIVLGFASLFIFHHSATTFNVHSLIPNQGALGNLSSLSILMFAMAGIEIIPTMATSIREPARTLPKALMLATVIIFLCYAIGTLAMNFIASPNEIANTTGLINTFGIIAAKFHFPWLTQFIALLITFSELGGIILWLLVPVIMFFKATERGIVPNWLHRTNKRDIPQNALLFQAALVTAIVLLTTFLPTVNLMYQVLVLTASIIFFIPYLFVVPAYIKFRWHTKRARALLYGVLVYLSLILAIALSFVPTPNLVGSKEIISYELELAGGPVVLILLALVLYRYRRSSR